MNPVTLKCGSVVRYIDIFWCILSSWNLKSKASCGQLLTLMQTNVWLGILLSKRQNTKRGSLPQCCLQRDSQTLNNQPFHSNNLSKQERPLGHGGTNIQVFFLSESIWRFNTNNQTSAKTVEGQAAFSCGHGFSKMPCKGVMRLHTSVLIEWAAFLLDSVFFSPPHAWKLGPLESWAQLRTAWQELR